MQAQQEKKTASSETQKHEMLERLSNLAEQNRAAYRGALEDFRDSFTVHRDMSFNDDE